MSRFVARKSRVRGAVLAGSLGKTAKSKELKRITAAELGGVPATAAVIDRIYLPEKSKQTQILEGPAKEVAAKLVEKLRFEVRVI